YLAQPATDLAALWTDASYSTLPTAYGNDTTVRDEYSPIAQPADAYAGVPLRFTASSTDTSIPMSVHTNALRAHIGDATTTQLIAATGNHNDPSHFNPAATVSWFAAHI